MLEERSFDCCFSFDVLGLAMKGDISMSQSQTIPKRASREIEEEYDDKPNNSPRSALHFRPTQTDEVQQPVTSNRISGTTRLMLYFLLLLCIAFLISGFNSPMLSGNVITLHVPMVWLVGIVAVVIVGIACYKSR